MIVSPDTGLILGISASPVHTFFTVLRTFSYDQLFGMALTLTSSDTPPWNRAFVDPLDLDLLAPVRLAKASVVGLPFQKDIIAPCVMILGIIMVAMCPDLGTPGPLFGGHQH